MWEQSMQVEALRLLAAWWDSSRPSRVPRRRRRVPGTATPGWPRGTKAVPRPTPAAR